MPSEAILRLLLRLEWITALVVFPVLFLVPAPYGRYSRPGWGPKLSARTAWVLMEAPSGLALLWALVLSSPAEGLTWRATVCAGLYLAHYMHRTIVFPLRMRDGGQGKPMLTVAFGVSFNLVNGMLNGHALAVGNTGHGSLSAVLGFALFAGGFAINVHADAILRGLRKPGDTEYRIPQGGAFKYVSAANYFGEIVEWLGFAMIAGNGPSLAFAFFTMANLVPRGWAHHQFYLRKFANYPRERRAIIPFVL